MSEFDLIIIGAGPAGMSAAGLSAEYGAKTLLIDEQPSPGGQVYRNIKHMSVDRLKVLGDDYKSGLAFITALESSDVTVEQPATVWKVDRDGIVTYSVGGKAKQVEGRHLIIANGALERPMPIPGWTLPGVLTAGAAQIMLKGSGVVPTDAVLVGSGPLLYLIATQLIKVNAPPKALVETQSLGHWLGSLKYLPGVLRAPSYLKRGWDMLKLIKQTGVPRYVGATQISINGNGAVSKLMFVSGGQQHYLTCETVLLHGGVVPNIQITQSLRLDHVWDERQHCFRPSSNEVGTTSCPNISVAGDGAGIGGADCAAISGKIAAFGALERLNLVDPVHLRENLKMLQNARAKELAIRPFLDALYRPSDEILHPQDGVVVCRCEETTAGDIRRFAKLGCKGPNQAKAFGRAGMGPCQGRFCGLTVTGLLAKANDMHPQDVGYFRLRSPLKPVSLEELATLADEQNLKE